MSHVRESFLLTRVMLQEFEFFIQFVSLYGLFIFIKYFQFDFRVNSILIQLLKPINLRLLIVVSLSLELVISVLLLINKKVV